MTGCVVESRLHDGVIAFRQPPLPRPNIIHRQAPLWLTCFMGGSLGKQIKSIKQKTTKVPILRIDSWLVQYITHVQPSLYRRAAFLGCKSRYATADVFVSRIVFELTPRWVLRLTHAFLSLFIDSLEKATVTEQAPCPAGEAWAAPLAVICHFCLCVLFFSGGARRACNNRCGSFFLKASKVPYPRVESDDGNGQVETP